MRHRGRLLVSCAVWLMVEAPAFAHHSAAAFDLQREVTLKGTVTSYQFKNPHIYISLKVQKEDGSTAITEVEAAPPAVLIPLGFRKDSIRIGEQVTLTGNPSRNRGDSLLVGKELYKSDGTYMPLSLVSRSIYQGKDGVATSIAGTWLPARRDFATYLTGVRGWPFTEQGRAAFAVGDPNVTTQKDCIPVGEPTLMLYPVASTIVVQRDRVVMKVDWLDTERIVYVDGRKHPPATTTFQHGHSVGHWEGKALIVETTNFRAHPVGLSLTQPSSTQKRLIERFSLDATGRNLIYSGTVEDPVYLTRPVEWSAEWQYRPGMPHSNQKCDLEIARRYLHE